MTQDGLETEKMEHCDDHCRLDEKEREWVHTAQKYVDSKHLPMAGKMLRLFDDTSTIIGRWILLALMFGGMAGIMWYIAVKLGLGK